MHHRGLARVIGTVFVLLTLMYCSEPELYSDQANRGVVPEVSSTTVETTVVTRTTKKPKKPSRKEKEEKPRGPHEYVGNTNTHRFHQLSCKYAGCPNCKAFFTTRNEAIEAGFRPCGVCDP